MSAPVQLNVTLTISGNPVVTVPISAGLQALDSNNAGGQGQVASPNASTGIYSGGQTGFSSVDMAVRNIFRAGCFSCRRPILGTAVGKFKASPGLEISGGTMISLSNMDPPLTDAGNRAAMLSAGVTQESQSASTQAARKAGAAAMEEKLDGTSLGANPRISLNPLAIGPVSTPNYQQPNTDRRGVRGGRAN